MLSWNVYLKALLRWKPSVKKNLQEHAFQFRVLYCCAPCEAFSDVFSLKGKVQCVWKHCTMKNPLLDLILVIGFFSPFCCECFSFYFFQDWAVWNLPKMSIVFRRGRLGGRRREEARGSCGFIPPAPCTAQCWALLCLHRALLVVLMLSAPFCKVMELCLNTVLIFGNCITNTLLATHCILTRFSGGK